MDGGGMHAGSTGSAVQDGGFASPWVSPAGTQDTEVPHLLAPMDTQLHARVVCRSWSGATTHAASTAHRWIRSLRCATARRCHNSGSPAAAEQPRRHSSSSLQCGGGVCVPLCLAYFKCACVQTNLQGEAVSIHQLQQ